MVQPGTILLGKYRVERILGTGGMGVVALVHHLQLDVPMAIKFLQPAVVKQPEIVRRFLREAQAAVKLKGEHICRIFDIGTLDGGASYMVMEYLQGLDLGEFLRQYGVQPVIVILDIMLQACEALAEAHAMGIVHRDVKPTNFFLTQRSNGTPLVKLLDFGISKANSHETLELTSAQTVLGTPAYMSPEQLRSSKAVDARTDIWALGVIFYELMTGRRPFVADTFSALCLKVALEPVPPLGVPLPPGLEQVVMRCLEKEPGARYQSVPELAAALEPYHHGARVPLTGLEPGPGVLGIAPALLEHRAPPVTGYQRDLSISTTLSQGSGHMPVVKSPAAHARMRFLVLLVLILGGVTGAVILVTLEQDRPELGQDPRESARVVAAGVGVDAATAGQAVEGAADDSPDLDDIEFESVASEPGASEPVEPETPETGLAEPRPLVRRRYTIESNPGGADVMSGETAIGVTPLEIELDEGQTRRYTIVHEGYRPIALTLPDAAGSGRTARVRLESSAASGTPKKEQRNSKRSNPEPPRAGDTLPWN